MMKTVIRDRRGATIVEFAIILPVMCLIIVAGLELGYRMYLGAVLQGALLEASRQATVGSVTGSEIDDKIRARMAVLTNPSNVKSIEKENFFNFSNVGKAEKITSDTDPIGVYNSTDCYEDVNNNDVYDSTIATGLGTADDIVRYTVTVTYPSLLPVGKLIGWGNTQTIIESTVLRNQPFASRAQPTIRCPS